MAEKTINGTTKDGISIKGTKEGIVVALGESAWPDLISRLEHDLQHKAAFFEGAQVILRAGTSELTSEQLAQVREILSAHGMQMDTVVTCLESTAEAAAALDMPVTLRSEEARPEEARAPIGDESEEALFVKRTVRSGQTIQHPGHVTIMGDVNPGGQVIASGDIVIWGKLRGTVHAGAAGDDSALVCALALAPTQLRIGNYIARSPEEDPRHPAVPEMARVQGEGIVVEPWSTNRQ
jgi:septum site-determining protein MinC